MKYKKLDWPLMKNNITKEDRLALIEFLKEDQILTQNKKVKEFEEAWSRWLGVKYSVFVNSGASANLVTMTILKELFPAGGEILVPTLTWVSDITSVLQTGFTPVFVDIDTKTLGMKEEAILKAITKNTEAIFVTHVMGFPAFSLGFINFIKEKKIMLIEDCCEAHGAIINGIKVGNFGAISNFSFYYAHHLSTIEGGMICTNNEHFYELARMTRSHGLVREVSNPRTREQFYEEDSLVNRDFFFHHASYNLRSTELNAVLGLSQLKRLDENNAKRRFNFTTFIENLNPNLYETEFDLVNSVNYAFVLVLKQRDTSLRKKIEKLFKLSGVEFRRGLSGGGNQLRQPYLKNISWDYYKFYNVEEVTHFAWYIGNYPDLPEKKILDLCRLLNQFS